MVKIANKLTAKKSYSQKAYLGRFPYNLVNSGNLEKYYNLLTNFQFIAEKINHAEFGVDALINDYDLVDDPEVLTNPEYNSHKVRALKLIQGALKLSAHVLSQDKTQLPGQLMGRLMSFEVPEIQAMLEIAKQWKATPWLRPLTANLTPPGGRLIRTLTGHRDWVFAVAVTPDGKQVISGSRDKTLKVWNLETGQEKFTLTGHSNGVSAVAVTPDGKYVISGSGDKTLKVWNLETGQEKSTLTGHSNGVFAVAVTPDGKYVISGSIDKTLKVWNLETGQEKSTLTGHSDSVEAVAVTPDGKHVISGSSDNTLKVWNLETGQEKSTLTGHSDSVSAVAVTPNGKYVISGSWDNTLKVWNLETGKGIFSFIKNLITRRQLFTLTGHSDSVSAVAVTPNGKYVISGSWDNTLKVWNLETGQEKFTLAGHSHRVDAVAVTPNGKYVISGSWDNTLKVWNLETGEVIASFTADGALRCCAVAQDAVTIAVGDATGRIHFLRLEGMEA